MASVKPTVQAFLIADHVYRDAMTGKAIIAGVFRQLQAPRVPANFMGCWAYVNLHGAPQQFQCQLRIISLQDQIEVSSSPPFPAKGPSSALNHCEVVIQVPPMTLQRFGAYEFQLVVNGEPLKGMRFDVKQVGESKEAQDE